MTMRLLFPLLLASCAGELTQGGDDTPEPPACPLTRSYQGFGGLLESDRPAIAAGSDRLRVKPFGALAAEYNRALGITGFQTTPYAATFGRPPARWFAEPQASANTIYAAFALAYEACGQRTATPPEFAVEPTPATAGEACRGFALAAWQREMTDAEAETCAAFAVEQTNPADDPRVRWAYACAAVLTATGFLTY
jgi:hypothetical protein